LSSFRVTNYKSFHETNKVDFEPGFNVIVGQNNTGKTALTEALSLGFDPNPHRSTLTIPNPGASPDPVSRAEVSFHLNVDDVKELLADNLPQRFYYGPASGESREDETLARRFLDLVSGGPTVEATFVSQVNVAAGDLRGASLRGYGLDHGQARQLYFDVDPETGLLRQLPEEHYGNPPPSDE
jgi:hypothetical protein